MATPHVFGPHDWQLRCTTCGRRKPLHRAGGVRIGLKPIGKRTVGFCKSCRSLRLVAVEVRPEAEGAAEAAREAHESSAEW